MCAVNFVKIAEGRPPLGKDANRCQAAGMHSETPALLPSHDHNHHLRNEPEKSLYEPLVESSGSVWPWQQTYKSNSKSGCRSTKASPAISRVFSGIVATGVAFLILYIFILGLGHNAVTNPRPWPGSPALAIDPTSVEGFSSRTVYDRVRAILDSTPLIDGHNDLAIFIRLYYGNNITSPKFRSKFENGSMAENVDLERLRSGRVGGAFWSAFVGCPKNASYDMSDANYAAANSATLEQIDLLRRLQAQYPRDFTPSISTPMDISGRENMLLQWHATRSLFGPLSIEGLHQVPPTTPFAALRLYHALGVRMATLTWNCHNPFADASLISNDWFTPPTVVNGISRPEEGAITTRGRQVLQEMNRLGIIIDLSHTSYWTQKAALSVDENGKRLSRAPPLFSHSSAYTLCPHPRNVRDDILDLVPKAKSLVMVNFSPGFISCTASSLSSSSSASSVSSREPHFSLPDPYETNNTLHQVARHIVYIGNRIGYDHVGLGADFDGMGPEHPRGLDGVDKFPDLVAELLRMGVSDADAKKVVGGNLLRLWKDVDDVAVAMAKEDIEPAVDDVS